MTKNIMVLFQGDSITDAGRNRDDKESLGFGYAQFVAAWFQAQHPGKPVQFLNRGIGGNRIGDLQSRWQQDCLELKPNIVSIMIGINDTWRRYDSNDPTSAEQYESGYRVLLTQTKNIGANLVLCEPFLLHVSEDRVRYREDLDPKIEIVRKLAREFKAILIPLDRLFTVAAKIRPPAFWSQDGVHPTPAGHALIAQHWLKVVEPQLM